MARFTPATTKAEAETLVRGWIDRCLWRQEARRADTGGFDLLEAHEIERMDGREAGELEALLQFAGRRHVADEQAKIAHALGPTGAGLEPHAGIIDAAAVDMGIAIDRSTPGGRLLARTVLRGHATLLDELRQGLADIPRQVAAMAAKPVLPKFEFFTYWDEFVVTKKSDKEWKDDTAGGAEATRKLFKTLIGNLLFNEIDGDIAGRFRRTYQMLPFDHYHSKRWRLMTPKQVLTAIEKLSEPAQKKIRRISNKSANKHIMNLIEYWDHLALHSKIPADLKNPFRGHLTARKQGRAARGEHPMWPKDLNADLFTNTLYRGCKSIHRRGLPGNEIHRDALFWGPLFGRLMGVREDEICGRMVGDIDWVDTEIGRVAYLKIRNSKTPSSSRDVPIHWLILELGFLEYRYYGRAPEEPLFPELVPQGAHPRRSNAFSGKFTEYRKKIKVFRAGVDFRSYRGNVETDLQNTEGLNAGWIDELIGHDSPIRRSEGARYTKSIYMANLKRTIDKVSLGAELPKACHYSGPRGVQAPGAAQDIARYVALAEREMRKKAGRRGP